MNALTAALWGALAASSLLLGSALALWLHPSGRLVGLVMGFGSGTLISAVAYELVPQATRGDLPVALGLAAGALAFFLGDRAIDRRGGERRERIAAPAASATPKPAGAGLAIFLGTLLDGIPESLVLGMGLSLGGAVGAAFLAAVFISNLPEGMAGTTSMEAAGMPRKTIFCLWVALLVASAAAAALGYALVQLAPEMEGGPQRPSRPGPCSRCWPTR